MAVRTIGCKCCPKKDDGSGGEDLPPFDGVSCCGLPIMFWRDHFCEPMLQWMLLWFSPHDSSLDALADVNGAGRKGGPTDPVALPQFPDKQEGTTNCRPIPPGTLSDICLAPGQPGPYMLKRVSLTRFVRPHTANGVSVTVDLSPTYAAAPWHIALLGEQPDDPCNSMARIPVDNDSPPCTSVPPIGQPEGWRPECMRYVRRVRVEDDAGRWWEARWKPAGNGFAAETASSVGDGCRGNAMRCLGLIHFDVSRVWVNQCAPATISVTTSGYRRAPLPVPCAPNECYPAANRTWTLSRLYQYVIDNNTVGAAYNGSFLGPSGPGYNCNTLTLTVANVPSPSFWPDCRCQDFDGQHDLIARAQLGFGLPMVQGCGWPGFPNNNIGTSEWDAWCWQQADPTIPINAWNVNYRTQPLPGEFIDTGVF